jgi:hypothetical protein
MASIRRRRPGRGVLISAPSWESTAGFPALPYEAGEGAVCFLVGPRLADGNIVAGLGVERSCVSE